MQLRNEYVDRRPLAGEAYMKTEDPELEDGPILLCQCCAHAVWLLAVGYLHVPCDPVPGLWAGQMGQ